MENYIVTSARLVELYPDLFKVVRNEEERITEFYFRDVTISDDQLYFSQINDHNGDVLMVIADNQIQANVMVYLRINSRIQGGNITVSDRINLSDKTVAELWDMKIDSIGYDTIGIHRRNTIKNIIEVTDQV